VPDPGQLRLAVAQFAGLPRNVACLQARLTIDNTDDSWLTRLFTIEYAALFDVFNPGLAEIGSPILLGGTSNHFLTSVLKAIHGWDAWNVTEDADLGIRLARLGYEVRDLPSSTLEEAPSTLGAWMRQRTRWMKGYVQTATSHSRKPWLLLRQLGVWRFYRAQRCGLSALFRPVPDMVAFRNGQVLRFAMGAHRTGLQPDAVLFRSTRDRRSGVLCPSQAPALAASAMDPAASALLRARQPRCLARFVGTGDGNVPLEQDDSWLRPDVAERPRSEAPGQGGRHQIVEDGATIAPPEETAGCDQTQDRAGQKAHTDPSLLLFGLSRSRTHAFKSFKGGRCGPNIERATSKGKGSGERDQAWSQFRNLVSRGSSS
jgi:hypothetical protein